MSDNIKRIYWADTLKGILIILVVLGHTISNYSSVAENTFWNKLCDAIYAFHMPAFFVVSGYLQAVSGSRKEMDKKYIWHKILSLGMPMVLFSVLYWCIKYVAGLFGGGVITNPQGVGDLLLMFINPIGEYWFLYALLLITLVDILFDRLKIKTSVQFAVWFVFLLAVNYIPRGIPFFWQSVIPRLFRFGIYFLLGKMIFMGLEEYFRKPTIIAGVAVTAVVSWICWYFISGFASYAIPKFILASATTFLMIIAVSKNVPSFIGLLGKNSLDIYLLHPYVIVACKMILPRLISNIGLYFVLSTAISIVLCNVARFVVSKTKYLDFVFRPLKYIK